MAVDRDGTQEEYSADVVVTSCGAINSAALLLASASDAHPNGLGNGSDQLGRHLMMHNNASLIAFFETPNLAKFQKPLGVHDSYFGDGDWPYPMGAIQMNGKSDAALVSFNARKSEDPAELARQTLDFWITTEDLPLDENRVPGRPRRPHQPALHPDQRRGPRAADRQVQGPAGRDALPQRDPGEPPLLGRRLGLSGVAHQNRTVRFGTDPATSALDLNCKMPELDNLCVVDSSFFVSSTAVNPTLTVVANALRVADHLADRLGSPLPAAERQPVPVAQPRVAATTPA